MSYFFFIVLDTRSFSLGYLTYAIVGSPSYLLVMLLRRHSDEIYMRSEQIKKKVKSNVFGPK